MKRKEGLPHKGWKSAAREKARRFKQMQSGRLKIENGAEDELGKLVDNFHEKFPPDTHPEVWKLTTPLSLAL